MGAPRKLVSVLGNSLKSQMFTLPLAENLMIVDLITHDLRGVIGKEVAVKKFCGVEESETVWQLVSVIEGTLPRTTDCPEVEWGLGWDILGNSLPPGESLLTPFTN